MNPTTIACAIAFAIGCAAGFSIEYAQVLRMENAITEQKLEAAERLKALTARTNVEILTNIETNTVVDRQAKEHENELTNLNTSLRNIRLRKPTCRTGSGSTESSSNSAGESKDTPSSPGVPEGLHELLVTRTYTADTNSAYAVECYKFVIERNCGIPRD